MSSRDTVGDAYFTKVNLVVPRFWKKVLVVTSDYHVSRTQEIFSFIYGVDVDVMVYGAPMVALNDDVERGELTSLKAFRDTFSGVLSGDDAAILMRLRERHPFYNGKAYAAI